MVREWQIGVAKLKKYAYVKHRTRVIKDHACSRISTGISVRFMDLAFWHADILVHTLYTASRLKHQISVRFA